MKRSSIVLCLCLGVLQALTAQNLQSALNFCTFNRPGAKPYVETYLMVRGETAKLVKNTNGLYQGKVEVTLTATRGDSVFYADKYVLNSPEVADTAGVIPNFIDKHTLPLSNGNYTLELTIADLNRTAPAFKGTSPITVSYSDTGAIVLSDIMAVESFQKATTTGQLTKGGYNMVPYVSTYYPATIKDLTFYTEVYNTDKKLGATEKFVVNTYIEAADNHKVLDAYYKTKVYTAQPVGVIFSGFDITALPSGNYYLTIDVRDKNNTPVAMRQLFFQRYSGTVVQGDLTALLDNYARDFDSYLKMLNPDTLREYIRAIRPISGVKEQTFIDKQSKAGDSTQLRTFFKGFWETHNVADPFKGWIDYLTQVRIAQREFGTSIRRGYMTDRGRVFLQYGPPNNRTASTREPSAYPYEVWHYYRIGTQNNRKFVFYNPDLVTNDYMLLHSDANGEPIDDQWQLKLHKRDTQGNNFDTKTINGSYGNRADELFNSPR